jgi:hypothetical protein
VRDEKLQLVYEFFQARVDEATRTPFSVFGGPQPALQALQLGNYPMHGSAEWHCNWISDRC